MHQSEDGQRRHILEFTRNDLREPMEAQSIEGGGFDLDDLMGDHLDPALVKIARAEEIQVFKEWKVYEPVPRSSMPPGKRVIGVRWVKTNKGTPQVPKVRSRLVCQEFAICEDPEGDLFAPTPPLGATRLLLSNLASRGRQGPGNHSAMFLDFKRAILYGDAER